MVDTLGELFGKQDRRRGARCRGQKYEYATPAIHTDTPRASFTIPAGPDLFVE